MIPINRLAPRLVDLLVAVLVMMGLPTQAADVAEESPIPRIHPTPRDLVTDEQYRESLAWVSLR